MLFFPSTHSAPGRDASPVFRHGRRLLTVLGLVATSAATAAAQSGTVFVTGATNQGNAVPVFNNTNAATPLIVGITARAGFGNTADFGGTAGTFASRFSGVSMLRGWQVQQGVLEVRLEAASGFNLFLDEALFGGFDDINTTDAGPARTVGYQLFSDDYLQSTALASVVTGVFSPTTALFGGGGWGNAIRIQFAEVDANGVPLTPAVRAPDIFVNAGAYAVGIQDIAYTVRAVTGPPSTTVPEPESFVLLAGGLTMLGVAVQRRRVRRA